MNVYRYFQQRMKFIIQYYDAALPGFEEIKRKIDAGEEPFKPPAWYDDDEPPFLDEWMEADAGIEVLGRSCLSMVSDSLKLYFSTWDSRLNIDWQSPKAKREYFANGFLQGYKRAFADMWAFPWDRCPADFSILEQATLARNRIQHPDEIYTMDVEHDQDFLRKHPKPFFMRADQDFIDVDLTDFNRLLFDATIAVDRERLVETIRHADLLCGWLEERLQAASYGHYNRAGDVNVDYEFWDR